MINTEVLYKRDPIEPHWPWGAVAWLRTGSMEGGGKRRPTAGFYPIIEVIEKPNGYEVIAGRENEDEVYSFEVDENGESPFCVPWDDDIQSQMTEFHDLSDNALRDIDQLGRGPKTNDQTTSVEELFWFDEVAK